MPDQVFISYAQTDQAQALAVCKELERDGTACWIAPRDVPHAADWDHAIVEAIEGSELFLLILSRHANESRHVAREAALADARKKRLLAVRVEAATPARGLAYYLTTSQWFDAFPPPLETHLSRLSTEVRRLLGGGVRPPRAKSDPAPVSFLSMLGLALNFIPVWLRVGLSLLLVAYLVYRIGGVGVNHNGGNNANAGSPAPSATNSPAPGPGPARGPLRKLTVRFRTTDDAKDPEDAVFVAIKNRQTNQQLFSEEYGRNSLWKKFEFAPTITIQLPEEVPYGQCKQLMMEVSKSISDRGWAARTQVEAEVDGRPVLVVEEKNTPPFELPEDRPKTVTFDFKCP